MMMCNFPFHCEKSGASILVVTSCCLVIVFPIFHYFQKIITAGLCLEPPMKVFFHHQLFFLHGGKAGGETLRTGGDNVYAVVLYRALLWAPNHYTITFSMLSFPVQFT